MPVTETIQVPDGGTLTLTQDEMQFLFDITGKVGGCDKASRRRHSNSIREALYGIGFKYINPPADIDLTSGVIYCKSK